MLDHKPEPKVLKPFDDATFLDIQNHVKEVRRIFDWPGIPYHDAQENPERKFNRWQWNNLPLLKALHNSRAFVNLASDTFGREVKPSYCYLSMYGSDGVCPVHIDRPPCQFTIDLCVNADGEWPIYVDDKSYVSKPGTALAYSGTGQVHYRKPMKVDGTCTYMDLVFFHFVPSEWQGGLD